MSAIATSMIVFACVFGGALFGMFLRAVLPAHHSDDDTKDVIRMGMGLITTMSALVLGLMIATAKGSYDAQKDEVTQMSAKIILVDRILAHYGRRRRSAAPSPTRSIRSGRKTVHDLPGWNRRGAASSERTAGSNHSGSSASRKP